MKTIPVNNYSENMNFKSLNKTKTKHNYAYETMIIQEVKRCAERCDFFEENDVDALTAVENGEARLYLTYSAKAEKPTTFWGKCKSFFKPTKKQSILLKEKHVCGRESAYKLAKKLRSNGCHEINSAIKKLK